MVRRTSPWATGVLMAMTLAAILVPALASDSARDIGDVLATRLVPPFSRDGRGVWHLLGTDAFGREIGRASCRERVCQYV